MSIKSVHGTKYQMLPTEVCCRGGAMTSSSAASTSGRARKSGMRVGEGDSANKRRRVEDEKEEQEEEEVDEEDEEQDDENEGDSDANGNAERCFKVRLQPSPPGATRRIAKTVATIIVNGVKVTLSLGSVRWWNNVIATKLPLPSPSQFLSSSSSMSKLTTSKRSTRMSFCLNRPFTLTRKWKDSKRVTQLIT
ncbi:hypothetical protein P389DRAFT_101340 [Cystobasidium minutum MCA 4210]|uniref:uncharacterized protein n=1 Tax=Cystobasidium minutum MCA 4210 TaxID=1397322 RepID=UPI0034CF0372|eukprot:jgi/Rhomi1/101340/CE101339_223